MAFPVSFRPLAQDDVEDALSWYGEERPALALGFAESLDAVITRISETPLLFSGGARGGATRITRSVSVRRILYRRCRQDPCPRCRSPSQASGLMEEEELDSKRRPNKALKLAVTPLAAASVAPAA